MTESLVGGAAAAPLSLRATAVAASAVIRVARQLLSDLEGGRRIDAALLRSAMEAAFSASDATRAWNWKTAYDAWEAAIVLFLWRHGAGMRAKAMSPAAMLPMLMRSTRLLPTHTRRSQESKSLQQFSTPVGSAFVASIAAAITPADVVLEPSTGTRLLAVFAELAGASLVLNEFAESRVGTPRRCARPADDDAESAVRFCRGWFLGDCTGAGKGRQIAGSLLGNWLKGRRRAVFKLIEDARRDWLALGIERLLVTPLSRSRQGAPIRLAEGVLFATYATLRIDDRGGKLSRARQIVRWWGSDFDGVIVFDESHAGVGGKGVRGDQAASQQRRAGPTLQHAVTSRLEPDAAFVVLMGGRTVLDFAEGLQLRRIRAIGAYCIELTGFNDMVRDRPRAYRLFGEIISWKLRMFEPTDANGVDVLAKVLDQYPLERIVEREAA
jgi:hypothetical protein